MTRRLTGLLFALLGLLLGLLVPAQAVLVSGDLVVVGHENYCADVGSTDAYACSLSETITTYTSGARYAFRANTANTGPATLALSGLSAVAITRQGAALSTGDILAGQLVVVGYDGTSFQCLSCGGGSGGAGTVSTGTAGRPAYYPSTSTTVDDATGLTFATDGTTLTSLKYRVTTKNASGTLGPADGPIVACTATTDVTLTLPAASSEQAFWIIIKVDSGAGACKVQRGGSDTINNGTSTVDAVTQWQRIDLVQASTINWVSVLGVLQVNLATQVTGDLPYANLAPATTASKLLGRGAAAGAGDWQEVTLGAGLTMTGSEISAAGGGSGTVASGTAGSAAYYPAAAATVDDSTGLTLSSTAVNAVRYRRTAISTTGTLGPADGPIIECTAASDVTRTLPTAASGPQSWYYVVKVDNGAGDCIIEPASGERINGTPGGTITIDTQWNYATFSVTNTVTPNWHAVAGLQTVLTANLANDAVTYAKMQNVSATDRVLCRDTAAAGDMEECTVTAPLQFTNGPGLSIAAASDTASGVVQLATGAETTTGTVTGRAVTPAGLAQSTYGRRYLTIECIPDTTVLTIGDGKCFLPIHADFNGWKVIEAVAYLGAVLSTSGAVTIDADVCGVVTTGIRCSGTNRDLFSTNGVIDQGEMRTTTGTEPVINIVASADIIATDEFIRVNVDGAGTGAQGLYVTVILRKP